MGIRDSIRNFFSTPPSLEEGVKERWKAFDDGTYRDSSRGRDEIAWRVGGGWFESWFQGLEQRAEQSLGRRLAHAAVEHEEYMMGSGGWGTPSGRDPASWSRTILRWETSGLGRFRILEDGDETRIVVEQPASGPICSGLITAAWEGATSKRHRFLWSESAGEGLVITLTQDVAQIPGPKPLSPAWNDQGFGAGAMSESNDEMWLDLRSDSHGQWSIRGERKMFLHRDLILRFEEYCLPYLDGTSGGRVEDYSWKGLDEKRSAWWTAAADSARKRFVAEAHHVLVRDSTDWISIARRHLSYHGLGGIESVKQIDGHGGVSLDFSTAFHPAIASGVLLGCWERAYGRNGRVSISFEGDKVTLNLLSSREIAA